MKDSDRLEMVTAIQTILRLIENKEELREELQETPLRVARAYEEMLCGYDVDVGGLFKIFNGEGLDQIVAIRNIPFVSMCEHHMLIFSGTVNVAYLPNGRVIGASKLPRLVQAYSKRLQIQERIAEQVAHAIMCYLEPHGVAVIIKGEHSCMRCRGANSYSSDMINSIMLGKFREDQALRMEVLSLIGQI